MRVRFTVSATRSLIVRERVPALIFTRPSPVAEPSAFSVTSVVYAVFLLPLASCASTVTEMPASVVPSIGFKITNVVTTPAPKMTFSALETSSVVPWESVWVRFIF